MVDRVVLLPEALDDAAQAYAWYEARGEGLGEQFLHCVDECIDLICRNPDLFEVVHREYRRAIVRRFPYVLFYEHHADEVTVFAVFHSAQDPEKWRRRLR